MHMRNRHPIFLMFRYFYLILVPIGALLLFLGEQTFGFLCILVGPLLFMRKTFWQFRLIHSSKSSPEAGQMLAWREFEDRYLSPKGILLYLQKDQYFILPKSAFSSQGDFEAVSKMCETKIAAL